MKEAMKLRQVLAGDVLAHLNARSNRAGLLQFAGHAGAIACFGYLWATQVWFVAIPALLLYGTGVAMMFAPVHECVHRTAFASRRLNDICGWIAGLFSLYNSTFFRQYHKWHHRYTQIPGKDPELDDPKPGDWHEYLLELSGLPWWRGKFLMFWCVATGRIDRYPFLSAESGRAAIASTRWQLATYAGFFAVTAAVGHPEAIATYWLLPLAIGQPVLRFVLLAEHTGCTEDNNPRTNTRTTLTLLPLRFLMWNMPFHAEHHLYPSIPFHALPAAREQLACHFERVGAGYLQVNREIAASFDRG